MPIRGTFTLNSKTTTTLSCSGYGTVEAFSGQKQGLDNPTEIASPKIGPIPPGIYYLVDRESGGRLGWLYEAVGRAGIFTTDRTKWFSLWNPKTGDTTMVHGIRRGAFRLHPEGPGGYSEGCITVVNPAEFELLQRHIRRGLPRLPVPGTVLSAYGTVEVR